MQAQKTLTKAFTGNSVLIFLARLFPALAFTTIWILASKYLSASEYGNFQKFWTQLFFISALAVIGFPTFIINYPPAEAFQYIKKISIKFLPWYILLLILVCSIFSCAQNLLHITSGYNAGILLAVIVINFILDALLIVIHKTKSLVVLSFLYSLAFCLMMIYAFQNHFSLNQLISFLVVIAAIRAVISFIILIKNYNLISANESKDIDLMLVQKNKFWWHLGLNDMMIQVFRWADKFVLSFILSSELFALYFNGATEIFIFSILFAAVSSAAIQYWANQKNSTNKQDKIPLIHFSTQLLASVMLPLFWYFIFFHENFLIHIFSEKYLASASIFIIAQAVLPLRCFSFTAILQSEHQGAIINKGALLDFVIAIILVYPLYRLLGLEGIVLAFVISTYCQAFYYSFHISKTLQKSLIQIFPLKQVSLLFIAIGFLMLCLKLLLNQMALSSSAIFIISVIVAVLITLVLFLRTQSLLKMFNKKIKKI